MSCTAVLNAASPEKIPDSCFQSRNSAGDIDSPRRDVTSAYVLPRFSFRFHSMTRRSGSLYGGDCSRIALTMEKIAVVTPIANAIVSTATAADHGLRRIDR